MIELLMVVAVISCVAAVAYFFVSGTTVAARSGKLQSDMTTVNNAIRTYLTHGGKIPAACNGQQVLERLKSSADSTSSQRLAGLRGTMLDARLRGFEVTAAGGERAVWNGTKLRFELKTAGTGFDKFDLGGDPNTVIAPEARARTMDLATKDHWVWDSGESTTSREAPAYVSTTPVSTVEATAPAAITQLLAPDFSIPGALYDYSAFNPAMTVSLTDPNPPGKARIFYSVDNGPWKLYAGTPLQIPPQLLTSVRAYAAAVDGEYYQDSAQRTENYETIFFTGTAAGQFHTPTGDLLMTTNLKPKEKNANFKWGDPATADRKQNELTFAGASFVSIPPDREFKLGTLNYYNGTTYLGTNATNVQIAINLDLTTPGVKETLNFNFRLLSTQNYGISANADADYVYIPDVSTNFRTTIKGQNFALVLRFGEHGANGFTTIDTFHAHEGKTLTGAIYGRLTRVN